MFLMYLLEIAAIAAVAFSGAYFGATHAATPTKALLMAQNDHFDKLQAALADLSSKLEKFIADNGTAKQQLEAANATLRATSDSQLKQIADLNTALAANDPAALNTAADALTASVTKLADDVTAAENVSIPTPPSVPPAVAAPTA